MTIIPNPPKERRRKTPRLMYPFADQKLPGTTNIPSTLILQLEKRSGFRKIIPPADPLLKAEHVFTKPIPPTHTPSFLTLKGRVHSNSQKQHENNSNSQARQPRGSRSQLSRPTRKRRRLARRKRQPRASGGNAGSSHRTIHITRRRARSGHRGGRRIQSHGCGV